MTDSSCLKRNCKFGFELQSSRVIEKRYKKHRHARHARVIFLLGGGGGGAHCGSNGILCFVENRN